MLNRKLSADSASSSKDLELQRSPKLTVVPAENHDSSSTNQVEEIKQPFLGNEAIRLTAEEQENYMEVIENPPELGPHVVKAYKHYLERKK